MIKGFWGDKGLCQEIEKRQYKNIEGLKAEITKKEYFHFLEVLPPIRFNGNSFYFPEFETGNLTLYFWFEKDKYFCEVRELNLTSQELGYF